MKKSPILLLLICFLISFTNCKEDEPTPTFRTYADVETDFKAIDITAGTHDVSLKFLDEKKWNFRIISPTTSGSETYPLIIDLHGASGGAEDAHQHTACYVEPGFEGMDVFIISPNAGFELWNSFNNQEMVINLILLAKDYWPIDANKIVVTGYSNGGNGSWFFGETQVGLFSAAIPMASSYSTTNTDNTVRVMPIPMYVIHGENDDLFPIAATENWVTQTIDAGSDITFVVAEGLGHYEPCNYVSYLQDAALWLTEDVW